MASGRPDYWYRMLEGHKVSVSGQSDVTLFQLKEIIGGANDVVLEYNVGANYRLHVTSGNISANLPGINRVLFYFSLADYFAVMFDQCYNLPAGLGGSFIVEGPAQLSIRVYNLDTVGIEFYASILGFTVYKGG